MTPEDFFAGKPLALSLFMLVDRTLEAVGPSSIRITKSQIAFRRRRVFAWVWCPEQYLRGHIAPLVLSISLRIDSKTAYGRLWPSGDGCGLIATPARPLTASGVRSDCERLLLPRVSLSGDGCMC